MKGVVLSFPSKERRDKSRWGFSVSDFFVRNSGVLIFTLFFTAGVVLGGVSCSGADEEFLNNMDFLFTTNLESGISRGLFSSFAAHFASDFIFFMAVFLCAFSVWGIGLIPFVVMFKGFGTGLSAVYLISTHGLRGLGFYLLVVLPGTLIFAFCLLSMSSESSNLSVRLARFVFKDKEHNVSIKPCIRRYMLRCVYYLVVSAFSAACDMFLWCFASKLFF